MHPAFATRSGTAVPIWFVTDATWPALRHALDAPARSFADASGFEPKPAQCLLLPGAGGISGVLFGLEPAGKPPGDPFLAGRLPALLPAGTYRFGNSLPDSRLVALARDLVNTPANDLGPAELEAAARALGARHGAAVRTIVGEALLAENLPLIHAVGRASCHAPRLIDLTWGDAAAPKVTIVGKGVTFDTGGLDIKPESAMLIMKKDVGGAASALALAHMVMDRGLALRLRVLVPAVENAISGSAFRPLDIYPSRNGLSVEIGNTDAEGRLVLAGALALADEEAPDLMFDFATLTGAARVALGPDLPPFYTEDDALAGELLGCAAAENDPLWRMPLWRGYEPMLESKIADIKSTGTGGFAGSITAALFLRKFVTAAKSWAHFDVYAWTPAAKPGRPEGGECQAARALYALLTARYGN